MELELWLDDKGLLPRELVYMAKLKNAGITLTLSDYKSISSLMRDDLILWNVAVARVTKERSNS